MSHYAVIMVPVVLELKAADRHVAMQEAQDALKKYETFSWKDSIDGQLEAKMLAFYTDPDLEEQPPPPNAA